MSQVRAKKRKRQDSQHRLLAIVVMLAGVSCAAAASSFLPPVKAQEASQANLMKTTTTRQDFFQEPLGKQPGQVGQQADEQQEEERSGGEQTDMEAKKEAENTQNTKEANHYDASIGPEMIYDLPGLEKTSLPLTSGAPPPKPRPLIDLDYNINHHVSSEDRQLATSDHEAGNVNVDVWVASRRGQKRRPKRKTTSDDRLLQTRAVSPTPLVAQQADEEVELVVAASGGTTQTRQPSIAVNISGESNTTTERRPPPGLKCRLEKDLYLDFEEYRHSTCASCYNQFPRDLFKRKLLYSKEARIWLYDNQSNRTLLPNETQLIRRTFQDEAAYDKWRACCQMAVECCLAHSGELPTTRNSQGQLVDEPGRSDCPATWDGLACWPSSPGGQLAWRECPRHVYFLSFEPACTGHVSKQCFSNGSWFIRNNHEWSDYSHCVPMAIYVRRMLFSVAWHIISVLVITPALLTINKFSGRGGNKRVKILRNLLFWLLISSCIQAAKNSGIVSGLFEPGRPNSGGGSGGAGSGGGGSGGSSGTRVGAPNGEANSIKLEPPQNSSLNLAPNQNKNSDTPAIDRRVRRQSDHFRPSEHPSEQLYGPRDEHNSIKVIRKQQQQQQTQVIGDATHFNDSLDGYFSRLSSGLAGDEFDEPDEPDEQAASLMVASPGGRCKREATGKTSEGRRARSSPLVIFFCWSLVVAERIARLMGYSWMFTGAIYLCSALHFAPAEPPAQAIRWLMFLTNAFPIVIALVYVTSRTIVEPSPLNIIFQVPYYKLMGDKESLDYLWSTQLDCWLNQPKNERIEDIADLPNLILVCLNVSLFIITLIILCRINRPGSTRPDMSPLTYFKAAGTLVVLYGGHYALLAYRPNAESCYYDIIMAYAFLFVDGIQGIAVSYVFCYRTQEGKEIIWKYWRNKHEHIPFKWCKWLYCRNVHKLNVDNGHPTGPASATAGLKSRCNHQSTRSNNSTCNGHNETVTELINISDTPVTSNNKF